MKFADYFKDAIAYGESLGLRKDVPDRGILVSLESSRKVYRDDGTYFYPAFLNAWEGQGIFNDGLDPFHPEFSVKQQIKLINLFTVAYEKYLAEEKN